MRGVAAQGGAQKLRRPRRESKESVKACNAAAILRAEREQSVCGAAALEGTFVVGQAVQAACAMRAKTKASRQGKQ